MVLIYGKPSVRRGKLTWSDSCWVFQGRISSVDNIRLYCLEPPTLKADGNNHEAFFFLRFLPQAICSRVPCKIYAVCLVFCGSQYICFFSSSFCIVLSSLLWTLSNGQNFSL
uniref:Uncharacterized protein n=1 Tax=Aegilops tauschii subsp. strangulata TaxID=200361 RepID=A0A453JP73_AEGTS